MNRFIELVQDTSAGTGPDWVDLSRGRQERADWLPNRSSVNFCRQKLMKCGHTKNGTNRAPVGCALCCAGDHLLSHS